MKFNELINLFKSDIQQWDYYVNKTFQNISTFYLIKCMFNPRFTPVFLYRLSHFFYKNNFIFLAKFFSMINFIIFGIEITIRCEIGPGLIFPHTQGIVIGSVKIGKNAIIYNGVTIGAKKMDVNFTPSLRPIIGDNVIIGSGAKILGGIKIGNNVIIGANSVVLNSVPDNVVIAGIPAKEIKKINI